MLPTREILLFIVFFRFIARAGRKVVFFFLVLDRTKRTNDPFSVSRGLGLLDRKRRDRMSIIIMRCDAAHLFACRL
jgi:hypothetical protein